MAVEYANLLTGPRLSMRIELSGRTVYAYTGTKPVVPGQRSLVFIHGAANDHSVWALQSRYFAYHGFNVLALDLPGHGKSAGPAASSIQDMAQWLVRVLDTVGIEKAALVGHSMGSLIALEAAAHAPQRVEKLALIATAFPMKVSDALLDTARVRDHAALEMINVWSHSAGGQTGGNRAPGQWIMGGGMRLLERTAEPLYNDFNACNQYTAGFDSAAEIACPVLLISGSRDLMTPPRSAKALSEKLANLQWVTIDGSGHDLMAERPDAVLDALISFVE
ncbi:MAG TPA: alpha/beta hydrolase [Burkholderiales bacterium]|nr:alpha/beta hydrolase [Burkholderiales bacterium]